MIDDYWLWPSLLSAGGGVLLALLALPLAILPIRLALDDDRGGRSLLPLLAATARLQIAVGALLTVGLLL